MVKYVFGLLIFSEF